MSPCLLEFRQSEEMPWSPSVVCYVPGVVASVVVLGMVGNRVDGEVQRSKGRVSDVIPGWVSMAMISIRKVPSQD